MRLFIVLAVASLSSAAKLDKTYLPPNAQTSGGSSSFLETPFTSSGNGFVGPSGRLTPNIQNEEFPQNGNYAQRAYSFDQTGPNYGRPERTQAALERNAAILRQSNQNDGETFSYAFKTENGIYAEESGVATNGVEAQGGYTYTGDDGQIYSIRYTADQNGFVPQGDHLPTPPPIPEEILKALEQNARDEAAGIYDDGSYNEAKYGDSINQYENNNYGNSDNVNRFNGNANPGISYSDSDDTVVTNSAVFPSSGAGLASRGRSGQTNGQKAYLPPLRDSANGRNNFGGRSSFNARNGYQY